MIPPFRIQSANTRLLTCKSEPKTFFTVSKKKKIKGDRDQFNDTLIQLKMQNNELITFNKSLKQENVHLQRQIEKQEKLLKQTQKTQKTENNQSIPIDEEEYVRVQSTCQVIAYQRQLKDLEQQLKDKSNQIEEMKRDVRKTKMQELEIQCRTLKDSYDELYQRYTAILKLYQLNPKDLKKCNSDKIVNEQPLPIITQQQIIRDNVLLSQKIHDNTQTINQMTKTIQKLSYENQQLIQKKMILEKDLQERDKDIQLIKFEYSNPKQTIQELNKSWQQKMDLLIFQQQRYEQEIVELKEEIELLEKQLKEIKSQTALKEQYYKKEIDNLNIQADQLRNTILRLEAEQMEEQSEDEQDSIRSDQLSKKALITSSRKKLQKVSTQIITPIGQEMAARLKLAQIQFQKLDQIIYTRASKGIVMLSDLIELFKIEPFELNLESATLVARYLVEPEQDEWVFYDQSSTNDAIIAISILKNIVKPYELIAEDEFDKYHQELQQILKYNQGKVQDFLNLTGDSCSFQEFKKALEYCDILLTQKQEDMLSIRVFQKFGQFEKIKHSTLFDYFK